MRILEVVHGLPPYNIGGTEVYTYHLSQELAKRHKVFIFHRINNLHIKEYALLHNKLDNLEIFTINNTFRLCNSFSVTYKNDTIAEKFGLVLDRIKPDIVHIQHLLYLSTKVVEETKKRMIPLVFTLPDYWLICPQGQLLSHNWEICHKESSAECVQCILYQLSIKKNIFSIYYLLKKFIPELWFSLIQNIYLSYYKYSSLARNKGINLIEERILHMMDICSKIDRFIFPSKFLREKFIESGIPEDKSIVLSYGFNLDNFKDFQKKPSSKLRFAFIGNLLPAKGIHILIQSFNRIKNNNAELKIYGQVASYKSILGNYLKYIKKIAKNKNIRFMGKFDNKDVAKIFKEIDVLIVPSIWYENSPLVIQEAFLTKTPVIASSIGGIPELIQDEKNSLLFKTNDIDDLYEKINLIVDRPVLLEKLRQNIKPPKSIEENAQETEKIYENILSTKKLPITPGLSTK